MRNKKLMALPLLLVISLSFTGYAFASWTDTINISGTVTTATLNLTYIYVGSPDERSSDPYNIATTTVTPQGDLTGDIDTITLTVNNAFPGYKARVYVEIKNIGTINAKFIGFQLDSNPVSYDPEGIGWIDTKAGIVFTAHDSYGELLYVGGVQHNYTLDIEVTESATSGTTTPFTVGIVFEQGV
jgi:hypothetical protein